MYRFLGPIALVLVFALSVSFVPLQALADQPIDDSALQTARENKTKSLVKNAFQRNKSVRLVLDGNRNLAGKVTDTSENGFVVVDSTGQTQKVRYAEVREVKKPGMSTGKKIGIGIGVGLAGIAIAAIATFKPWRSE